METKMETNQEMMKAMVEANNVKFEALRGISLSLISIRQTRTEPTQGEMEAKMDIHQERLEVAVYNIRFGLEKTIQTSGG
jgi:hypothetical protein